MNILQAICIKHTGQYFEDDQLASVESKTKAIKNRIGKIPLKGEIYLVKLAMLEGPYSIFLELNLNQSIEFNFYNISKFELLWSNLTSYIFGAEKCIIDQRFKFLGNKELFSSLSKNHKFLSSVKNEYMSIQGHSKGLLKLKPFKGIYSLEEFENYFNILAIVKHESDKITHMKNG